jgi:hypothetical protein
VRMIKQSGFNYAAKNSFLISAIRVLKRVRCL